MIYKLEGKEFSMHQDHTRARPHFYCVMQNPFRTTYNVVVLQATSFEILQRKIEKQYKKFEKEGNNI